MFGWGTGLGVPSVTSDPDKEREPPALPTPLDFPVHRLPDVQGPDAALHDLYSLLASIKRPQDITLDRFKPFNVHVENDVDDGPDRQSTEASGDTPRPMMSNDYPYPPNDRFEVLRNEVLLNNDDCFREVARLPALEGRTRVRVTQTRKFWTALERMSQYWDDTIDNYYDRPPTPKPETGASDDKMQEDNPFDDTIKSDPTVDTVESDQSDAQGSKMDVDGPDTHSDANGSAESEKSEPSNVPRYKGRRVGTGHEMPDEMRDETIRAFVEMVAWPFGCQVTVPTLPPRLSVQSLLFPVRQSFQAARSPRDRQVARTGILEGPVLIAQCRPETTFRAFGESHGDGIGEVCDLFREVGGMLLAAQERAREGTQEQRPGEGKWWTTQPRFGGAPNDGILDDLVRGTGMPLPQSMLAESKPSPLESENARKRHKFEYHSPSSLARRPSAMRRMTSSEKWKILQPGPSLWDKRMRYMQIGKIKESPFDDIYMVSSINHHIALVHLRVHRRYLEILTNGSSTFPEDSDDSNQPWHVLNLQRTRWYDLLDANDRLEGLKGVWSMFHYQARKT
ncbi:hypothetical protein N7492_002081 [Penicillium capsulatum]|uniref:Uncharacterized protein n=1 Tax=Penicillium capsulatum TaxID=69766 RepID=A0A9W9LUV9_9EURO|nr:hypothetical protein N7492_002081 [Penicillium capsulatum]KAJ6123305.1 hypothetical protein N7512_005770 [Penicillium capsulatum]